MTESLEVRQLLAAELRVLKNIAAGSASSFPPSSQTGPFVADTEVFVAEFNGLVYFGLDGGELWKTDGTEANTTLVQDMSPGVNSTAPAGFTEAGDALYFACRTETGAIALFRLDGVTSQITKITEGAAGLSLESVGDTLYFQKSPSGLGNGNEIWKTDGTPGGTQLVKGGLENEATGNLNGFDGHLFFISTAPGSSSTVLWRSDGTTAGTTPVPGAPNVPIGTEFIVMNGSLFFFAPVAVNDLQLFEITSGTASPVAVTQLTGDNRIRAARQLTNVDGRLYALAQYETGRLFLWRKDNSSEGGRTVRDLSIPPDKLTAIEETLFFSGGDFPIGQELWRSNAEYENTVLVKDLLVSNVNGQHGYPDSLFNMNGLLVFTSFGPSTTNRVFWVSNGTTIGTTPFSAMPVFAANNYAKLGNKLVFAAENSTVGREPFVFTLGDQPGVPVTTGPAAIVNTVRPTVTWNAVSGAEQYAVWFKNQSTGEELELLGEASGPSFTPTVDLGIGYHTLWVRSLGTNGAANSAWSQQRNFRIKAPVIQKTVTVNPGDASPTISWQPLAGAVTYDVWIDRLDVPTSQILRDTDVTGTSITPTTLPQGDYRVWVRGIAADGSDGAWSNSQDFSTAEPVPIITGGLNPTFDTTPEISWTPVIGASSYEVYVLSIHGNFKAVHQKNIAGTSFTWPVLPAGPYRYWVRVTGATVWSNPVDINTAGRTDVLTPAGTTSDNPATFTWRPVDGAVRYELWVDQQNPWVQKVVYRTNLTSTSFVSGMPLGTFRTWVRAVSATNQFSPWSQPVDFTIAEAGSTVDPGNHFALLTSIFSDAELNSLLEKNELPVEDSRVPGQVPGNPREESLTAPAIAAIKSNEPVDEFAMSRVPSMLHPMMRVVKRSTNSRDESESVDTVDSMRVTS